MVSLCQRLSSVEELQRLTGQMKAIDASIAAARSQLENLMKEDERTVWETNIVILKAATLCTSVLECGLSVGHLIRTYTSCDSSKKKAAGETEGGRT